MNRKQKKRLVTAGVAGGLVIVFSYWFFVSSWSCCNYYFSYLAYPALLAQHYVAAPIKNFAATRRSMSELEQKITALQEERDAALAQTIELSSLINFEQDVQEIVEYKKRYDFSRATLAQILVKNFSEQSHFFLIDRGAKAGIEKDMVVIVKDCLIGRVAQVYPYYSKVVLVSDQSCKVAAYCTRSKASGIYNGTNQEWMAQLLHVSHLSQPEVGEMVISSGDGLIFPRGFGLGKIKAFTTKDLFHEIEIEPLVDLRALSYCYVVQKT